MGQQTPTQPGSVSPTGITASSQRLSAGAAATIGALCAGGAVPVITRNGVLSPPKVVSLQVERGQANIVYYTVNGTDASAINGFEVPVAPGQIVLPYPDHLAHTGANAATNQQISLFAGGATNVQCEFAWW